LIECILHLGSNQGLKQKNIELAELMISHFIGKVTDTSALYLTSAWGLENQADFLNKALICQTRFEAEKVLHQIQLIEQKLGRVRLNKWEPRIIDIDIIFYGEEIIENENLKIPHSELTNRNFVLVPLLDICANKIHPVLQKTVRQLKEECKDTGVVKHLES